MDFLIIQLIQGPFANHVVKWAAFTTLITEKTPGMQKFAEVKYHAEKDRFISGKGDVQLRPHSSQRSGLYHGENAAYNGYKDDSADQFCCTQIFELSQTQSRVRRLYNTFQTLRQCCCSAYDWPKSALGVLPVRRQRDLPAALCTCKALCLRDDSRS